MRRRKLPPVDLATSEWKRQEMLMITEERNGNVLAFKLAGVLAGDWVTELNRCWDNATTAQEGLHIIVDLTEVTYVDEEGKDSLASMMSEGAELRASDILMRSIVEEIVKETSI